MVTVTIMLTNGSIKEVRCDSLDTALSYIEANGFHKDDNVEGIHAEEGNKSWTLVADHCLYWEGDWNDSN